VPEHDLSDTALSDPDLRDRLVYAALAHRDTGGRLAADDDHPESELALTANDSLVHPGVPIQLRHRPPGAGTRNGPPPGQPTPEDILHSFELLEQDQGPDTHVAGKPAAEHGSDHRPDHQPDHRPEPPPPF
jgi:hypothetical protein